MLPSHKPEQDLLLQPIWNLVLHNVDVDTIGHPLFFVFAVMTTVLVVGLAFSFVDVFVTKRLPLSATAKYLLITLPGYILAFVILQYLPIQTRIAVPLQAPTVFEFLRDFVLCLVFGDLISYWWHRLEHGSKLIFKRVHYVHHKVSCPLTVWSGFYVHPIESLCVFIAFYVYPFVSGVHQMVFIAYAAVNTFVTMITHCGYQLSLYPKSIFAYAQMHDHHHDAKKPANFCVLLTLSDRIFGTYQAG